MKKILTLAAMLLLTVMGLSACTAKTNKANGRSSESLYGPNGDCPWLGMA